MTVVQDAIKLMLTEVPSKKAPKKRRIEFPKEEGWWLPSDFSVTICSATKTTNLRNKLLGLGIVEPKTKEWMDKNKEPRSYTAIRLVREPSLIDMATLWDQVELAEYYDPKYPYFQATSTHFCRIMKEKEDELLHLANKIRGTKWDQLMDILDFITEVKYQPRLEDLFILYEHIKEQQEADSKK